MPKKIDPAVRERVMRAMAEHRSEFATPTLLAKALAARERIGAETVHRWIVRYDIDAGTRQGRDQRGARADQGVEGQGQAARR